MSKLEVFKNSTKTKSIYRDSIRVLSFYKDKCEFRAISKAGSPTYYADLQYTVEETEYVKKRMIDFCEDEFLFIDSDASFVAFRIEDIENVSTNKDTISISADGYCHDLKVSGTVEEMEYGVNKQVYLAQIYAIELINTINEN